MESCYKTILNNIKPPLQPDKNAFNLDTKLMDLDEDNEDNEFEPKIANLVYFNSSYYKYPSIYDEFITFKKETKGAQLIITDLNYFHEIKEYLAKECEKQKQKFLLIIPGSQAIKDENKVLLNEEFIREIIIFTTNREQYKDLLKNVKIKDVCELESEVINLIQSSTNLDIANNTLFNPLMTIKEYLTYYIKWHKKIIMNDCSLYYKGTTESAEDIINRYTKEGDEIINYKDINKNLGKLNKNGINILLNAITSLIFSLIFYWKNNKKNGLVCEKQLIRWCNLKKEELLNYIALRNTIIVFPTFMSTSGNLKFKWRNCNTKFKIFVHNSKYPNAIYISKISDYESEDEYLFLPFSCFKILNVYAEEGVNIVELESIGKNFWIEYCLSESVPFKFKMHENGEENNYNFEVDNVNPIIEENFYNKIEQKASNKNFNKFDLNGIQKLSKIMPKINKSLDKLIVNLKVKDIKKYDPSLYKCPYRGNYH